MRFMETTLCLPRKDNNILLAIKKEAIMWETMYVKLQH